MERLKELGREKFNISKLTKKQIRSIHTWTRGIIQLVFFLFIPSVYTAAFSGVKYVFTQLGVGGKIELTSFVTILIAICLYTIVFGRFFCGFACAFGSLGDWVNALYKKACKKLKKKPIQIKESWANKLSCVKYIVLAAIAVLCYVGLYSKTQGTSAWDVFSMIHAGNFHLNGYAAGVVILLLILVGMCVQERFFCRFLCPMGAVFSVLPILPFFTLHRDRGNCIKGCSACTKMCPSNIELPKDGSLESRGDCFQCQKCIGTCPKGNIQCGSSQMAGNEIGFTLLRALFLVGMFLYLGI